MRSFIVGFRLKMNLGAFVWLVNSKRRLFCDARVTSQRLSTAWADPYAHTSGVISMASKRMIRGRVHVLMRHNKLHRYRIRNNNRVDDGQLLLHSCRSSIARYQSIDIRVSIERHHPHTLCSLRQPTKYTASKACRAVAFRVSHAYFARHILYVCVSVWFVASK